METLQLTIRRYVLGQLDTNCYLLWKTKTGDAVVIDPADDATILTEEISRNSLTVNSIVLTHGHFDHVLGLLELQLATGAPAYMHANDLFLLRRAQQTAEHFLGGSIDPVPTETVSVVDGQQLYLTSEAENEAVPFATILHLPGHTPGSIGIFIQSTEQMPIAVEYENDSYNHLLFVGDTLLPDEKTDLSHQYSSSKDWFASRQKLQQLPAETLVMPGHGLVLPIFTYRLATTL